MSMPMSMAMSENQAKNWGQSQSSYVPHGSGAYYYGFGHQMGQDLVQRPTPFFPGQTYVGPSAPTQIGTQMGMAAMQPYMQGAGMYAGAAPMYGNAANVGMQTAGMYNRASDLYRHAANQRGGAANLGKGAIGNQFGILGGAGRNFNFLSSAADVTNNPYVQNQLAANKQQVMTALTEDMMPAVNQGAMAVGALGSGRHGLAQGTAMGKAAEALTNANASTMLNAYGQGLGAQQAALGQTGAMLQHQLAPAMSHAWAANQISHGAGEQAKAAEMGGSRMRQMQQAANLMGMGGDAWDRAAGMLGRGASEAFRIGGHVEGYQGRALRDAMQRHAYQYLEPRERLGLAREMSSFFGPLGVQHGATYGYNDTEAYVPMMPQQGEGLGGMMGGIGSLMTGIGDIF